MGDNRNGMEEINTHTNEETRLLAQDFIYYKLEEHGAAHPPLPSSTRISRKLREVTCLFERKYRTTLEEMFSGLQPENQEAINVHATFQGVMNELFIDGITWSRIVAMFYFSGGLAIRYVDEVDQIVEEVTQYIDVNLQRWISDHGGWDGFVDTFDDVMDDEGRNPAWKKIVSGIAAGALGAMAIGALLTSRT